MTDVDWIDLDILFIYFVSGFELSGPWYSNI